MASSKVGVTDSPDVGTNETPDVAPTVQASASPKKLVTLQRNWKQEVTISGVVEVIFLPGESRVLDSWITEHSDFNSVKEYFVVQEVL